MTGYDSFGRVDTVQYPSGYTTKNHYHSSLGILQKVTKDGSSQTLWEALSYNERGQLEAYKLGTNLNASHAYDLQTGRVTDIAAWVIGPSLVNQHYEWGAVGNLASRQDTVTNVTDNFIYDNLNRLANMSTTDASNTNQTTSYDALGNINSKSDVGAYAYGGSCNGIQAGPHAATSVGGVQYCYDQNGNMLSGDGRNVSYTTFNKPYLITKGGNSTVFWYGPNRERFMRQDTTSSGSLLTVYVGNYEKTTGAGGTKEKIYLGDYAVVIKDASGEQLNFLIKDHLGSTIAITDEIGAIVERLSYDEWGKRRHTNGDLNFDLLNFTSQFTNRGYTGHEHVDSVGLVHMNGRVYDPIVGRLLQADPFIQAPNNLQSYNRYSYVWNNPVSAVDPSGYWRISLGPLGDIKGDTPGFLRDIDDELHRAGRKFDRFLHSVGNHFAQAFENKVKNEGIHFGAQTNGSSTIYHVSDGSGGRVSYTRNNANNNSIFNYSVVYSNTYRVDEEYLADLKFQYLLSYGLACNDEIYKCGVTHLDKIVRLICLIMKV